MGKKIDQTVRMMTPGQMKDIISAVAQGVPTNMIFEVAENWVGNKGRLTAQIRKIFSAINPYSESLADWQSFYHDLGLDCDLLDEIVTSDRTTKNDAYAIRIRDCVEGDGGVSRVDWARRHDERRLAHFRLSLRSSSFPSSSF